MASSLHGSPGPLSSYLCLYFPDYTNSALRSTGCLYIFWIYIALSNLCILLVPFSPLRRPSPDTLCPWDSYPFFKDHCECCFFPNVFYSGKEQVVLFSFQLNCNLTTHGAQTMHYLNLKSCILFHVEYFIPSSFLLQPSPSSYQV